MNQVQFMVFPGHIHSIDVSITEIAYGDSCRLSSACKTYQGECLDMTCSCGSERYHDASTDICVLCKYGKFHHKACIVLDIEYI